jgi:methylenetetrahydrofolate dehydrogenase (NADP+)/methenyltetrahydrofolate cyclohydrolase
MEKILSGKPIAALIRGFISKTCSEMGIRPAMALLQVGMDPAADYYVQSIIKNGAKLGCDVHPQSLPVDIGESIFLDMLTAANNDPAIHGIMVQKPLPEQIDDKRVGQSISVQKDIDCLNPINLGRIMADIPGLLPCTPAAVYVLLNYYGIPLQGKNVTILGRSTIVGKPLANMLLWKRPTANATVTVCHSRSENLAKITSSADILVAAIGKANFVNADMIKENSVLVDVGINEVTDADGKTKYVGDIDYKSCYDKALAITPVPGGIGTITSALLFLNLLQAYLNREGANKSIDDFLPLIFSEK